MNSLVWILIPIFFHLFSIWLLPLCSQIKFWSLTVTFNLALSTWSALPTFKKHDPCYTALDLNVDCTQNPRPSRKDWLRTGLDNHNMTATMTRHSEATQGKEPRTNHHMQNSEGKGRIGLSRLERKPKESLNGEPPGAGLHSIYTRIHVGCTRLSIELCTVHTYAMTS